jgi:SNF2 family DNA or RNA helicase
MELRKVCNHPYLNYPLKMVGVTDDVVRSCGKLYLLDRILVKLKRTGHRVLLFCTMTRLLDIVEEYCRVRRRKCAPRLEIHHVLMTPFELIDWGDGVQKGLQIQNGAFCGVWAALLGLG